MELAFGEAWVGRERRSPGCPACGSERLRYSRREYEGVWARLFRLRPVKCLDCGVYFPLSQDSSILNPNAGCPLCGSESVRPSRPGGAESFWSHLDIRAWYRCATCNGSFRRIVPVRLAAGLLIGALALTGLVFLGGLVSRRGASAPHTPTVKPGQIPEPPPPVFR